MVGYLPVVLFLALGWFLNDPVALFAAGLFVVLTLGLGTFQRSSRWLHGVGSAFLFGIVGIYLISTFTNRLSPVIAAQGMYQRNFGMLFWISLAVLFSYTSYGKLKAGDFVDQSMVVLLVLGVTYGLLQRFNLDPFPWRNPYDAIQLTLGNPNFAGAFFGMLSVIPLYLIATRKSLAVKVFGFGLLGVTIFVALGTKSLQAIVVMAVSLLVFILNFAGTNISFASRSVRLLSGFGGFMVLVGMPVLLFAKLDFLASLRDKFFFQGSVAQRLDYWRTGIEIFKDHPWFGVGPDQFQRYAALYRTKEQVNRDGAFTIPDKAHSVLIDSFANGGVFAGLLWASFVVYVFVKLVQASRMNLARNVRVELAVVGGIWSGYVFQALISPDQLVLAVIGFMAAGLIVYISKSQVKTEVKKSRLAFFFEDPLYARTLFVSLLIFSVAIWSQAISADIAAKRVLSNENLTRDSVLVAVNQWPTPKTTELIAIAVSQADTQCDLADEMADRLIEVDDRSAQGWYLKAICFNVNRKFEQALGASEKALSFDPLNPTYLVAKAKLGIASGRKDSANSALGVIKENYPDNPEIAPLESSITLMP